MDSHDSGIAICPVLEQTVLGLVFRTFKPFLSNYVHKSGRTGVD